MSQKIGGPPRGTTHPQQHDAEPRPGERYQVRAGDTLSEILFRAGYRGEMLRAAIAVAVDENANIPHADLIFLDTWIEIPAELTVRTTLHPIELDPVVVTAEAPQPPAPHLRPMVPVGRHLRAPAPVPQSSVRRAPQSSVRQTRQSSVRQTPQSSVRQTPRPPPPSRPAPPGRSGAQTPAPPSSAALGELQTWIRDSLGGTNPARDALLERAETLNRALSGDGDPRVVADAFDALVRGMRGARLLANESGASHARQVLDDIYRHVAARAGFELRPDEHGGRIYALDAETRRDAPLTPAQREAFNTMRAMTWRYERQRALAGLHGRRLVLLPLWESAWEHVMRRAFELDIPTGERALSDRDREAIRRYVSAVDALLAEPRPLPEGLVDDIRSLGDAIGEAEVGELSQPLDRIAELAGRDVDAELEPLRDAFAAALDAAKKGLDAGIDPVRDATLRDALVDLREVVDASGDPAVRDSYLGLRNAALQGVDADAINTIAEGLESVGVLDDRLREAFGELLRTIDPMASGEVGPFPETSFDPTTALDDFVLNEALANGATQLDAFLRAVEEGMNTDSASPVGEALEGYNASGGIAGILPPPSEPFDFVLPEAIESTTAEGGRVIIPAGTHIRSQDGAYYLTGPGFFVEQEGILFEIAGQGDAIDVYLGPDLDRFSFAEMSFSVPGVGLDATNLELSIDRRRNVTQVSAASASFHWDSNFVELEGARIVYDGNANRLVGAAAGISIDTERFDLEATDVTFGQIVDGDRIATQASGSDISFATDEVTLTADSMRLALVSSSDGSSSSQWMVEGLEVATQGVSVTAAAGTLEVVTGADGARFITAASEALSISHGTTTVSTEGLLEATLETRPDGSIAGLTLAGDGATVQADFGELVLSDGMSLELVTGPQGDALHGEVGHAIGHLADGTEIEILEGTVAVLRDADGTILDIQATADEVTIAGSFGSIAMSEGMHLGMSRLGPDGGTAITASAGRFVGEFEDGTRVDLTGGDLIVLRDAEGRIVSLHAGVESATASGDFGEIIIEQGMTLSMRDTAGGGRELSGTVGSLQGTFAEGTEVAITGGSFLMLSDADGNLLRVAAMADTLAVTGDFGSLEITEGMSLELVTHDDGSQVTEVSVGRLVGTSGDTDVALTEGSVLVMRRPDGSVASLTASVDTLLTTGTFGEISVQQGGTVSLATAVDGSQTLSAGVGQLDAVLSDGTSVSITGGELLVVTDAEGRLRSVTAVAGAASVVGEFGTVELSEGMTLELVQTERESRLSAALGRLEAHIGETGVTVTDGGLLAVWTPDGTLTEIRASAGGAVVEGDFGRVALTQGEVWLRETADGTELGLVVEHLEVDVGSTAIVVDGAGVEVVRDEAGEIRSIVASAGSAVVRGDFGEIILEQGMSLELVSDPAGGDQTTLRVPRATGDLEGTAFDVTGGEVFAVRDADGNLTRLVGTVQEATVRGEFGEAVLGEGAHLELETTPGGDHLRFAATVGNLMVTLSSGEEIVVVGGQASIQLDGDDALLAATVEHGTFTGSFGMVTLDGIAVQAQSNADGLRSLVFSGDQIALVTHSDAGDAANLILSDTQLVLTTADDGAQSLAFSTAGEGQMLINGHGIEIGALPNGALWAANVQTDAAGAIVGLDLDFPGRVAFTEADGELSIVAVDSNVEFDGRDGGSHLRASFGELGVTLHSSDMNAVVDAHLDNLVLTADDSGAFRVSADRIQVDAALEDLAIRIDGGRADVELDPEQGVLVHEITGARIHVEQGEDLRLDVDIQRMKELMLRYGQLEGEVEGFALALVPLGDDSTLSLQATGWVGGQEIVLEIDDVRALQAMAIYGDNYARLYAGDTQGHGNIKVRVGPALELEGSEIDIRAQYVGMDSPFASDRLFRSLRRYTTRQGWSLSPFTVEPDGVVRLGGKVGPVRGEIAVLVRRTPGDNPLFMWHLMPDGIEDQAPGVMLGLGLEGKNKGVALFGGVTDAAFATVEQVEGAARLYGVELPERFALPMAAMAGVEARLGRWQATAGRYEALAAHLPDGAPIRETNPAGYFATIEYTDPRFRVALETMFDEEELQAARATLGLPLGGGSRADVDERIAYGQARFARALGVDRPERGDGFDETWRPNLARETAERILSRLAAAGAVVPDDARQLDIGETLLAQPADRALAVLTSLEPSQRLLALESIRAGGGFEILLGEYGRRQRRALVDLVVQTDDAALCTALAHVLVAHSWKHGYQRLLGRMLDSLEDRADSAAAHFVAAAVLDAPERSHGNDDALADERRSAARILQRRLNLKRQKLSFDFRRAVALGVEGAWLDPLGRQLPDAVVQLATADARGWLTDASDGAVFRAVIRGVLDERREELAEKILESLPRDQVPLLLASLGSDTALRLVEELEDNLHAGEDLGFSREDVARYLLWPDLSEQTRVGLAGHDAVISDLRTAPADTPVATLRRTVVARLTSLEQELGIRVRLAITEEELADPRTRSALADALDGFTGTEAAEVSVYARDGEIVVEPFDPANRVDAAHAAAEARWFETRLAAAGISLSAPASVALRSRAGGAQGYAAALDYLDRYRNVLERLGIAEVRFGTRTRLREVQTGVTVKNEAGEDVEVEARVLELDADDLLEELGSPDAQERREAMDDLSDYLGDRRRGARWYLAPHAGLRAGDRDLGGSISFSPGGSSPVLYASVSEATGAGVGARGRLRLGPRSELMATAGVRFDPGDGDVGPMAGLRISHLIFGDPGDDTQAVLNVAGFYNGWRTNVGVMLYATHEFGEHELEAFARATLVDILQGGPHLRLDLELWEDAAVHPILGVGNRLGPYLGVGFGHALELRAGLMGASAIIAERFEVGVRFLPIPLPFFAFHPSLTKYSFSYDPFDGSARIEQIGAEGGLANIPPPVLAFAFDDMMGRLGIDARNEEVLAWIDAHGLGPQLARLQQIAANHPDAEVRARAALEERTIMETVGSDLMIREYLRFAGEVVEVSDRDVERRFDERRDVYTVVASDVLLFGSEAEARAATARFAADPTTFDAELARESGHTTRIEFALGQPGVPVDMRMAVHGRGPGQLGEIVALPDGRFAVMRVASRREPDFRDIAPGLREAIREELRLEQERERFNRFFNEHLNDNKDLVERGIHAYRGALLERARSDAWRSAAAGLAPRVFDDERNIDVPAAKEDLARALAVTRAAVRIARGKLTALDAPIAAVEQQGQANGDRDLEGIGRKMRRELKEKTGDIDELLRELNDLQRRVGRADDRKDLVRLEERRDDLIKRLRRRFDDLTLGESELEELTAEVKEKDEDLAAPLREGLLSVRLDPTVLVLCSVEYPGQASDHVGRRLARRFQQL